MVEQERSAAVSNAIFLKKLDEIAKNNQLGITNDAKEAIVRAAKKSEEDAIKQVKPPVYTGDVGFYRGVLSILGASVIITTIGGLALVFFGIDIPQFIVAIGTTALGALAGLLAPSPVGK